MKRPDLLVRQTTSIVISKFPSTPSTRERRAMHAYLTLMHKLFKVGPEPNTKSRDHLTDWAQRNFSLWKDADYAATSPSKWGPLFWSLMLRCARLYTRKRRNKYSDWLDSLIYLLPCKNCARHYRRMLESSLGRWKRVRNSDDLVEYITWMQSTVRRRLQGEEKKLSPTSFKTKSTWPAQRAISAMATRLRTRQVTSQATSQATRGRSLTQVTRGTSPTISPTHRNAIVNMVTKDTNTSGSAVTNMVASTRNRNGSRLGGWYGGTSAGVGANYARGYIGGYMRGYR
jgi:hypothetical protein